MGNDDPIAFFITWTVFGSHLQGDERGWRRRRKGLQLPEPQLEKWHMERLTFDVVLLSHEHRQVVESECERHCDHRQWKLWAVNARSNHVHVVATAVNYSGKTVCDQLKANCTRALRQFDSGFRDRQVWSVGGDWECINSIDDVDVVCQYVREAQDRKRGNENG